MSTVTTATLDEVRTAVEGVADPELPPVTLGMLGMVHDVTLDDGRVEVELLPTFSGCPATEMMGRDVRAAVGAVRGVEEVVVRWRFSPAWSSDRITEEGRRRLAEFGIAPPTGGGPIAPPDALPAGRTGLPLALGPDDRPGRPDVPCPWCGSDETERDSPFGPTPCRSSWFCRACTQPFEHFKEI